MSILEAGIQYRIGDVLDALDKKEVDMVGHGVNCRGAFGSGIAGQIARRYPFVRNKYMEKFLSADGWKLGDTQIILMDDSYNGRIMANCATQDAFGFGMHANYDAIYRAMVSLHHFSIERGIKVAIPMIGAGEAGGDWAIIQSVITDAFQDDLIYVYILENEMNPPESLPREILDQLGKKKIDLSSILAVA